MSKSGSNQTTTLNSCATRPSWLTQLHQARSIERRKESESRTVMRLTQVRFRNVPKMATPGRADRGRCVQASGDISGEERGPEEAERAVNKTWPSRHAAPPAGFMGNAGQRGTRAHRSIGPTSPPATLPHCWGGGEGTSPATTCSPAGPRAWSLTPLTQSMNHAMMSVTTWGRHLSNWTFSPQH